MTNSKFYRTISFVLALVITLSLCPVSFADGEPITALHIYWAEDQEGVTDNLLAVCNSVGDEEQYLYAKYNVDVDLQSVPDGGYPAGTLSVVVQGIGDICSEGVFQTYDVNADPIGAESSFYNWSYYYDDSTDEYVFINNNDIYTSFFDTLRIVYKIPAADTVDGYVNDGICARIEYNGEAVTSSDSLTIVNTILDSADTDTEEFITTVPNNVVESYYDKTNMSSTDQTIDRNIDIIINETNLYDSDVNQAILTENSNEPILEIEWVETTVDPLVQTIDSNVMTITDTGASELHYSYVPCRIKITYSQNIVPNDGYDKGEFVIKLMGLNIYQPVFDSKNWNFNYDGDTGIVAFSNKEVIVGGVSMNGFFELEFTFLVSEIKPSRVIEVSAEIDIPNNESIKANQALQCIIESCLDKYSIRDIDAQLQNYKYSLIGKDCNNYIWYCVNVGEDIERYSRRVNGVVRTIDFDVNSTDECGIIIDYHDYANTVIGPLNVNINDKIMTVGINSQENYDDITKFYGTMLIGYPKEEYLGKRIQIKYTIEGVYYDDNSILHEGTIETKSVELHIPQEYTVKDSETTAYLTNSDAYHWSTEHSSTNRYLYPNNKKTSALMGGDLDSEAVFNSKQTISDTEPGVEWIDTTAYCITDTEYSKIEISYDGVYVSEKSNIVQLNSNEYVFKTVKFTSALKKRSSNTRVNENDYLIIVKSSDSNGNVTTQYVSSEFQYKLSTIALKGENLQSVSIQIIGDVSDLEINTSCQVALQLSESRNNDLESKSLYALTSVKSYCFNNVTSDWVLVPQKNSDYNQTDSKGNAVLNMFENSDKAQYGQAILRRFSEFTLGKTPVYVGIDATSSYCNKYMERTNNKYSKYRLQGIIVDWINSEYQLHNFRVVVTNVPKVVEPLNTENNIIDSFSFITNFGLTDSDIKDGLTIYTIDDKEKYSIVLDFCLPNYNSSETNILTITYGMMNTSQQSVSANTYTYFILEENSIPVRIMHAGFEEYAILDTDDYDFDLDKSETMIRTRVGLGYSIPTSSGSVTINQIINTPTFIEISNDTVKGVGFGEEYSYTLNLSGLINTALSDIVIYDFIETGSGSEWHGLFKSLDISAIEDLGYNPIVYYTDNENAEKDIRSSDWTTDINACSNVRGIALDFGNIVLQPDVVLAADINMIAPDSIEKKNLPAVNNFTASVSFVNANTGAYESSETELVSNDEPIYLAGKLAKINVTVVDDTTGDPIDKDIEIQLKKYIDEVISEVETKTTDGKNGVSYNGVVQGFSYQLIIISDVKGYQPAEPTVVNVEDSDYELNVEIRLKPILPGKIKIMKYASGKSLQGAEFELYQIGLSGEEIVANGVTDENGQLEFSNLPYGEYHLIEEKAPEGYHIGETNSAGWEIELTEDNQEEQLNIINFQDKATLTVKAFRYDTDNDCADYNKPITDYTYTLLKDVGNGLFLGAAGYKLGTSDVNYGTYKVTETEGNTSIYTFVRATTCTIDPGHPNGEIEILLDVPESVFTITKKDSETGEPIQGVTFELYALESSKYGSTPEDRNLYYYDKTSGGSENNAVISQELVPEDFRIEPIVSSITPKYKLFYIGEATTDENGQITFDPYFYGNYVVKEMSAPNRYKVNDDLIFIKLDDSEIGLNITNDPYGNFTLLVTVEIDRTGIYYEHGTPVFTVRVEGETVDKDSVVAFGMVAFDETDELNFKTISFELPAGIYKVSLEDTARYSCSGICEYDNDDYPRTIEIKTSGDNAFVRYDLSDYQYSENDYGTTFQVECYDYRNFSDAVIA